MKIKSFAIALAVALVVGALGLAGCASNQAQPISPQQIATIACPQLNLVHTQLVALNTALQADPKTADLGKKGAAQLAAIDPIVRGVCNGAAAAPQVDFTNIQTLAKTAFPALSALAAALPLTPAQQAGIQAAMAVAETATGVVAALQQQAPAPASTAK
ncbi:MAG: hypothetical protein ACTHMO_12795 [Rhodanobacteraceae bacterium]